MLISKDYAELNRQMHARPEYGVEGQKYAAIVRGLAERARTYDILDYGCGKRTLECALGFPIKNYDPAIEGLDADPEPAQLVTCTDVLEHIEPECLEAVLDHIRSLTLGVAFLAIAVKPAQKLLPDGTNPHKIVHPWEWWMPKLQSRWRMIQFLDMGKRFIFAGTPA